ncbi:MAG: ABC transporter substrate-binding protein [Pseudomonadota bacterium]
MAPTVHAAEQRRGLEHAAEVVHWWEDGADARAVDYLRQQYEAAGGVWLDTTSDYQGVRRQVVSRLAKGYPPTAMLWNASVETDQLLELGFLNGINQLVDTRRWRQLYFPAVLRAIQHRGNYTGLPLNLHTETWLWLNRRVFESAGVALPTDWASILAAARQLEAAGRVALVASTELWQRRVLFNTVLLGVSGKSIYERLYAGLDVTLAKEPQFLAALEVFLRLTNFARQAPGDSTWPAQAHAFASGEAAMFFMGDWAKAEFVHRGLTLGTDFDCLLTPGNPDRLIYVLDVLAFGASEEEVDLANQRRLIGVVERPEAMAAFNAFKGSVSPLRAQDTSALDRCARASLALLSRDDAALPTLGEFGDGRFGGAFESVIDGIWRERPTSDAAAGRFVDLLRSIRAQQSPPRTSDRVR